MNEIAHKFHFLDMIAIAAYFVLMMAIGIYFARRNRNTDDYFLGNRSIPGWALGLSMMGAIISSITFLALPAGAYALDWRMILPNLMLPVSLLFAIFIFIPLFRAGISASAFEYLEMRYGSIARLYGAVSFIILQVLRIGMVLYLVALPLKIMLGVPMLWVILVCGVITIIYTASGGFEAVVWTDVIQAVILLLGGVVCFTIILLKLPGGLGQVIDVGMQYKKFSFGEVEFNLLERTMLTMIITGTWAWIAQYSSDQNVVQRYLAAPSLREARKATVLCAATCIPTWFFFFFLGTCLFVYYKVNPSSIVQSMEGANENDGVLPYFIVTEIPAGIMGLIIAGVLAAAMSTLSAGINAISTVTVSDFFRRYLVPGRDEKFYLDLARYTSLCAGGLMIAFALIFWKLPKESMMDVNLIISAVFGGALSGLFLIGLFTRRVHNRAMLLGLGLAVAFNIYLMLDSMMNLIPSPFSLGVHAYWVALLVNILFMVSAYAASFVLKSDPKDIHGLTIWTIDKNGQAVDRKPRKATAPLEWAHGED